MKEMDYNDIVSKVKVYGLEDSIKRSKYPMSVNIDELNDKVTNTVINLGNAPSGSGHSQFLHGIIVQFDLKFSVKAWTEEERYHWIEFISSQSTMHKITKFNLDECYMKYVDNRIIDIMKEKLNEYNKLFEEYSNETIPQYKFELKEKLDEKYLELLYSNPNGFRLVAGLTTNYEQLKTIYFQRRNHRLPEWRAFCKWIETLPMFKELCLKNVDK